MKPTDAHCHDVRAKGTDETGSGDAKIQKNEGIIFLSNLKKAIVAEDERMTRILNKKKPQIIASHYMS